MDTALKSNKNHFLSFSRKLFLSVVSLFLIFAACFIAYQYQREKEYKIELLDTKLQDCNERLYQELCEIPDSLWHSILPTYIHKDANKELRITIINLNGKVLFDSYTKDNQELHNHIKRPEIQTAIHKSKGYDVRRTSETTGTPYFYSATLYDSYIIRSALPYDVHLIKSLAIDSHYLRFAFIVSLVLIIIFHSFTTKLGLSINQLREFAMRADKNEPLETDMQFTFPNNELGDISRHIVQIYKRAQETKEEQTRLKRQLTQNIAHELKTPVSSIQGYLETIVNNKNIPPERMNTFLEHCYAQSKRLSRLLRDISVLTRMDEASNLIEMETVNINTLVNTIIHEVSLELEEKQIKVIHSLPFPIILRGNYSLLYSIFRNLMDNAIAYAGIHIDIYITCFREDENFYYFSFSDTGTGVPQEHLERLFERFYRIDKGRSRKLGGTGLGLAIVKNAIIIHGGTISVQNNPKGGLKFIFTLAKEKEERRIRDC